MSIRCRSRRRHIVSSINVREIRICKLQLLEYAAPELQLHLIIKILAHVFPEFDSATHDIVTNDMNCERSLKSENTVLSLPTRMLG